MEIKLSLNGGLGYYFCGSIALSINNNIKNPISVDSDKLTDKEIIGLARAAKSGVVKVLEGEATLLEKAHFILSTTKSKKLVKTIEAAPVVQDVKEKLEQIIEEIKAETVEVAAQPEVTEEPVVDVEKPTEELAPVEEEKKVTKTTKRTVVKK